MKNYLQFLEYDYNEMQKLYEKQILPKFPRMEKILKLMQADVVYSLLTGKDNVCVLPTAYGKTLIMLLPSIFVNTTYKNKTTSITLIISPLIALMINMCNKVTEYGLHAFHCKERADFQRIIIKKDEPNYILTSPELVILKSSPYSLKDLKIHFVMIDEAHLISEWGKTFRTAYAKLAAVRSYLPVPVGLFTATVSKSMIAEIKCTTGIREAQLNTVVVLPVRPEITVELKEPNEIESINQIASKILELQEVGKEICKTIIFVKTTTMCTSIFLEFEKLLDESIYVRGENNERIGWKVNYFSASTELAAKNRMIEEFSKTNSTLRVVICTISFGIGLDFPEVRKTIIYGLPSTYLTLWQLVGRVGRGDLPSKAILIPTTAPGPGVEVKIPDNMCIRQTILSYFHGYKKETVIDTMHGFDCCSFCSKQ